MHRRDGLVAKAISGTFDVAEGMVEFGTHLARRRYQSNFQWEPTAEEVRGFGLVELAVEARIA